ncbi:MAG: proteinase inhibitor serpin [Deltaproteobacteria bacterium]|nr:proteinase inhibitor serpin [Deltaproteobacteria bacterium]
MKLRYLLLLPSLICVSAAASFPGKPVETGSPADTATVVAGNTRFALDLYNRLRTAEGNLFLSPYSISAALAMTCAGARGTTEKQMAETLHFMPDGQMLHPAFSSLQSQLKQEQEKGQIKLSIANALWVEKGFSLLKNFTDLTGRYYEASVNRVGFKNETERARLQINAWVEDKTKNKIQELIKPGVLDSLTRLVLTNAIYFKGNWARRFKKDRTREEQFWMEPGTAVMVPMMNGQDEFGYLEDEMLQALELPYAGDSLSMIVLLPRSIDGLGAIEDTLAADTLTARLDAIRKREVRVSLPKFTMTSQFELARTLGSMGMPEAFSGAADFSGMTGGRDLFISAVVHKAFVDVNEEGTEAAAATGVAMRLTAAPVSPPVFRADHPFIFLIRHNPSGSILFLGRLTRPAEAL